MTPAQSQCRHKRGDQIKEMGFWLCADCWGKLDGWPTKYGAGNGYTPGAQAIIWRAAVAEADGLRLDQFLRTMARRYMTRTRPPMSMADAYDAAIIAVSSLPDPYGDPAYAWDHGGAREMADDDMDNWDRDEGANA